MPAPPGLETPAVGFGRSDCIARQELEQERLELNQGGFIFLADNASRSVYFQVLSLSFEDYSAFPEIVVEA
jgi:hypothetical protein